MRHAIETIGDAVLYLGDCREILPTLGKVDAVVTDPPFGVGNFVQQTGNKRGERVSWNESAPSAEFFANLRAISRHRIIWGANFFNCFEEAGGAIVWVKNQPMPDFSKAEIASSSWKQKTELVRITWTNFVNTKESAHPCERPIELYTWCIEYLPNVVAVCDPFMGSGSCGVASLKLGRKFIGIEIKPKYFDIACKRIEEAWKQPRLFEEPKPKAEQLSLLAGDAT